MSGSLAGVTALAAAESFVYNNENQSEMQFGDSSAAAITGTIAWEQNGKNGKQNKYGLATTGSAGGGEFRVLRSDTAWQKAESAEYMVMSAQIMPFDDSVTSLCWATQESAAISYNSSKEALATAAKLVQNKWNTFTTIYKLDGTYFETYLNGVKQFAGTPLRNINYVTYKRIQLHIFAPTGTQFGLDNVRMYQVSELPTISAPSIEEGENYTVSGNVISVSGGIELTATDLNIKGSAVRVYRDSSMSEVLSQGTSIGDKNVVVIEDSEGNLAYYDVSVSELKADIFKFDEKNKSGLASADESLTGTFTWTENGTKGKAQSDGYAVAVLGSASNGELRLQKGSWTKQNGASYAVLSADMMIPDGSDIYRVFWGTNSSQRVAHEQTRDALIMKKLKQGVWNNYTVVFDINSQYAYTYINGELIVENKTQSTIVGKRIQFHVFGREGNKVYVDNLYGYQTSVYPKIEAPSVLQAQDGNIKIYSNENVTVENLNMANVNASRVYTDSTLTQITSAAALEEGNVVVVEGENGMAYYDVKETAVNDGLNISSVPNIENGVLKSVEIMSGKDVEVNNNESLVFAAYENDVLTALQVVAAPVKKFEKNKSQKIDVNINVDNADSFSVMLVNLDTLSSPCTKTDYSFESNFDEEDAILYFYPNYKKKAVSFSIDDGDFENDPKFVSVLNQYGLKGTFNLVSDKFENYNSNKKAEFINIYDGHEVGNHVRYHPEYRPNLTDNDFETLKPVSDIEGMYYGTTTSDKLNRYYATTAEAFIKAVELGKEQVEATFEGSNVKAYAYPGGNDSYYKDMEKIYDYLDKNYTSVRETGQICYRDEFDAPEDMKIWNTTVYYNTIEEYGEKFINKVVDDESNLQLFTVGTHATDYVNKTDPTDNGNYMDDLERFCAKCQNNESEIWSATISDIADYLAAKKELVITSEKITNNSDTDLYLEVRGKKIVIPAKGSYGK